MRVISNPTERITAVSDIFLALIALGGILVLHGEPANYNDVWKINIWSVAFGLIGLAAALGAVAHGLAITRPAHDRVWHLLNLSLALAVSLFVAGVVYDVWGVTASLKVLPAVLLAGLAFFGVTLLNPGIFFVFIVFEGLALFFALGAYIYLAGWTKLAGAGFMAAGILFSILAAGIQTNKSISLTVIWQFDHNGIYHLVQIVGLLFLIYGIHRSVY